MKNYSKDISILEKAINEDYSLHHLLELYKSKKYSYFLFSKKVKIIFLILSIITIVLGLFNYLNIITIFGILGTGYFSYSLGVIKGYNIGSDEGLRDGFESGYNNCNLQILKILIEQKSDNIKNPEKGMLNIFTLFLSNKFSSYTDLLKDKNMIEFEINKIIEREKLIYWDKGFKD